MHHLQNKYSKNDEYSSECIHKKCRHSTATLRIFDVCNQEKRQVIRYTYSKKGRTGVAFIKYAKTAI